MLFSVWSYMLREAIQGFFGELQKMSVRKTLFQEMLLVEGKLKHFLVRHNTNLV